MNAFVSWSGGKDCCQAAYLAVQEGYRIRCLLNMVTAGGERSCSHGLAARWITLQSAAMNIPLVQKTTTGENYETVFTEALKELKAAGIETGIFGDIDFNPHREWIEKVCSRAGITPVLPLWQKEQPRLAQDFIREGFKSVIVAARADLLGREWVGRIFDNAFLADLANLRGEISPCGESGEFHSLVIDGPLFSRRLDIREKETVRREDHWFLDIIKCELVEK